MKQSLNDIVLSEGLNELNVQLTPIVVLARLFGTITDAGTGEPMIDVRVTLNGMEDLTDHYGDYIFYNLAPRDYTISVEKLNYQPYSAIVSIAEGDNELNVALAFTPTMEGIEVRWMTVEPLALYVGDSLLVSAQVLNISGREGDFAIVCNINGRVLTQTIHLTASGDGSWDVVYFRPVMETAGTFTVAVGDKSQVIEVAEAAAGLFCCPYCGVGPITSESLLFDHIKPKIGSVRVTFIMMGADGELHTVSRASMQCVVLWGIYECEVMCPICKGQFRISTPSDARGLGTQKLLDHIKARHGVEALYCVNTPEGGYGPIPKLRGPFYY